MDDITMNQLACIDKFSEKKTKKNNTRSTAKRIRTSDNGCLVKKRSLPKTSTIEQLEKSFEILSNDIVTLKTK